MTDPVPLSGQLRGQDTGGLHRPPQRRLRISPPVRLDQRQQHRDQFRINVSQPLAARARHPDPAIGPFTLFQLAQPTRHRGLRRPRSCRHQANPAVPPHPGSSPQHQPSLPLVQIRQQQPERLQQPRLDPLRHTRILRANRLHKSRSYFSTAPWVSTVIATPSSD